MRSSILDHGAPTLHKPTLQASEYDPRGVGPSALLMDCGEDGVAEVYCNAQNFDFNAIIEDLLETLRIWRTQPAVWLDTTDGSGVPIKERPERIRWWPADKRSHESELS